MKNRQRSSIDMVKVDLRNKNFSDQTQSKKSYSVSKSPVKEPYLISLLFKRWSDSGI